MHTHLLQTWVPTTAIIGSLSVVFEHTFARTNRAQKLFLEAPNTLLQIVPHSISITSLSRSQYRVESVLAKYHMLPLRTHFALQIEHRLHFVISSLELSQACVHAVSADTQLLVSVMLRDTFNSI